MNKITVDSAMGSQLAELQNSVELCDPSGRIVGWFQPAVTRDDYEGLDPPFSEEELRRAEQEEGGRPLKDILADLERRK